MKNIREDKGFTYGIQSSLNPYNELSFLSISADVKKSSYNEIMGKNEKEVENKK